jgi:ParB-like chromosome segregation protein Spo0J
MLIKKNGILALGVSRDEVRKYRELVSNYGSVCSTLVNEVDGDYRIMEGQERLEGMTEAGVKQIPVIVTHIDSEVEETKLSLRLAVLNRSGNAVSQGAMIADLVAAGVGRKELLFTLGKSKAWLSKRESLGEKLSEELKELVGKGIICDGAAGEISRLPKSVQLDFAKKTLAGKIGKKDIGELVSLYLDESSDETVRQKILENPVLFLAAKTEKAKRAKKGKDGNRKSQLSVYVKYAADFMNKAIDGLKNSDPRDIDKVVEEIETLLSIAKKLYTTWASLRSSSVPF